MDGTEFEWMILLVTHNSTKNLLKMQQVKNGDTVKVHYHGRLSDGTTFDSSEGRDPLEFEVGSGMVIKGFDDGVVGMEVGDKRTLEIPADEAYGDKNPDMLVEFPKEQFPEDMKPEVGMRLNMTNGGGQVIPVVITEVKDESVILDANHPLAGEDLVFDIELVDISGKPGLIITP
jgi:peptidylprolyl isomerase